jgi:hypothetical protein
MKSLQKQKFCGKIEIQKGARPWLIPGAELV